jgi:hypothetical protein
MMAKIKVCSYCGVPEEISEGSRWESNGTISATTLAGLRSFWYEAEGLNALFRNIGESVGMPIDRLIIEGKRKNSLQYLQQFLSGIRGFLARTLMRDKVYNSISDLGAIFGYGHFDILEIVKGEYVKIFGRNIYNLPMLMGDLMATFNAVEGLSADIQVEEKDDGLLLTVTPGEKPGLELTSRLEVKPVPLKPGNIFFEPCPKCGVPLDFKECKWSFEEGTITDTTTGRNMVSLGMEHIDAVFRELEAELGEDIARIILKAQGDYAKRALTEEEMERGFLYFNRFFALRGMGNLVQYDLSDAAIDAVVENASPPLMVAGMLQGIFEATTGRESACEYVRGDDGTLLVKIKAV